MFILFFTLQLSFANDPILISGAGPAGLTIALRLLEQGKEVLIVEKRQFGVDWGTREQVLGLSSENKDLLVRLGVNAKYFSKIGAYVFHRDNMYGHNPPIRIPYGPVLKALTYPILRHNPEYLIGIGTLERELLDIFLRKNGIIKFQTEIHSLDEEIAKLKNTKSHALEEQSYTWLVNAEGAHSNTLALLDIKRIVDESWETLFVTGEKRPGIFPSGKTTYTETNTPEVRYSLKPTGDTNFVSTFFVTDGRFFSTGLDLRGLKINLADIEAYPYPYLQAVGLNTALVRRMRISRITIEQSHLDEFYFPNERMLVIGDAAHTVNPLISYGINLALKEAAYIGTLIGTRKNLGPNDIRSFENYMRANVRSSQNTNRRYVSQSRLLTHGPARMVNFVTRQLLGLTNCLAKLRIR